MIEKILSVVTVNWVAPRRGGVGEFPVGLPDGEYSCTQCGYTTTVHVASTPPAYGEWPWPPAKAGDLELRHSSDVGLARAKLTVRGGIGSLCSLSDDE